MQDDFRIFGNGKSSKTTKKHQHHKFPSGLGYPKPEGKDKEESYTLFFGHYHFALSRRISTEEIHRAVHGSRTK